MAIVIADQSSTLDHYGVKGQSYVADRYAYAADSTQDYHSKFNKDCSRLIDNYDAAGNKVLETVTAANGSSTMISYDSEGRVTQKQSLDAKGGLTTWLHDAISGAVTTATVVNADKTKTIEHSGIVGETYVSDRIVYAASGAVQSITRYHADGTLDYYTKYNADGSRLIDNFNAAGKKTLETVIAADGGRTTVTYDGAGHATQKQSIVAGTTSTWTYDVASGAVKTMTVVHPDKTSSYDHYGIVGPSYTSDHDEYRADGAVDSVTRYHADGTLDYYSQYKVDGGRITANYDAGGNKMLETLSGSMGADKFVIDAGNSKNTDFKATEGDKIDFSKVDAVANKAGGTLDHFVFAGDRFTGEAGQIIAAKDPTNMDGKHWLVQWDTNGDGQADLVLHVTSPDMHILGSSDFLFGWS